MRDKDFYNLIEQGNEERKEQSWQNIRNDVEQDIGRDGSRETLDNGSVTAALIRSKKFIITVTAAFLIVAVLIIICTLYYRDNGVQMDGPRYYSKNDYSVTETDITLKEYSAQQGLNLLYFDWYEQTDFAADTIYMANQTGEIICFNEKIRDRDTGNLIDLCVAEANIQTDFLAVYYDVCTNNSLSATGVESVWGTDGSGTYAMFSYNEYRYYLQIENIAGNVEDILRYVEALLAR